MFAIARFPAAADPAPACHAYSASTAAYRGDRKHGENRDGESPAERLSPRSRPPTRAETLLRESRPLPRRPPPAASRSLPGGLFVSPYEMNSPTHGTVKTSVRATATSGWRRFTSTYVVTPTFSTGAKHLSRLFCRHGQTTRTAPATSRRRCRNTLTRPVSSLPASIGRYDLRPDRGSRSRPTEDAVDEPATADCAHVVGVAQQVAYAP